ncbi:MAG: FAD-dependent oxidoreductase [Deltaproteobacteria bacterium]|jgi:2,4-dienoyl-CoA reductase (NADPH2)|nr:FAD-dependent oxidoreductase [Deltaproteobacteria bacterium]
MFDHLASPLRIGGMELRNRIAMAAMGVEIAGEDGHAGEPIIAYYEERARGGVGLIITEVCAVAYPRGANAHRQLGISSDEFLPGLRQLTERVHRHGAKIALQLVHHGKISRVDAQAGREVLMPSIPRFPGAMDMANDLSPEEIGLLVKASGGAAKPKIKEATKEDIEWLIDAFASAADRARQAGFDGVEIHAAHGYLLSEFLSPAWNFREDEYGGSIENRSRLLCEVVHAAKKRAGEDFPVWARLDCREFRTPGGITPADAARTAELVTAAGADAIHVTAYSDATSGVGFTDGPLVHREAGYAEETAAIKARVDVPVIAVGRIEPEVGESMIREGKADVIAMARKLLADPELAKKLVEGREKDVRPCIYCYTCVAQPFFDLPVRCAVNPVTGNEHTLGRKAAEAAAVPRRVLVVGGGPAGLEAARLARLRGHEVVLCEKSAQLGGTLRFAALVYEPNEHLLDWLARQVERVGVDVRLRTEVTPELVREIAPDLVLVAAGARRQRPAIPGVDRDHVFDGEDLRSLLTGQGEARSTEKLSVFGRLAVRAGRAVGLTSSPSMLREASKAWMPLGREVVIVGGGLVGLELAEFLAERGRRVTVLEEEAKLGLEMAHPRRWRILDDLRERGVELVPQARVRSIEPDAVAAELTSAKGEVLARSFPADTVVLAVGLEPNPAITASLEGVGVPIREIGDVAGVGYLEGAIRDGFHAALEI